MSVYVVLQKEQQTVYFYIFQYKQTSLHIQKITDVLFTYPILEMYGIIF